MKQRRTRTTKKSMLDLSVTLENEDSVVAPAVPVAPVAPAVPVPVAPVVPATLSGLGLDLSEDPHPVLARQTATERSIIVQYEEKLKHMEEMMRAQSNLMMTMANMHVPTPPPPEHPTSPNLAGWPSPSLASPPPVVKHDPLKSRREKTEYTFEELYANEGRVTTSENITLIDGASGSRWGSMPQTQTNVGMRTRGLFLNPTLQQPSIGGLL